MRIDRAGEDSVLFVECVLYGLLDTRAEAPAAGADFLDRAAMFRASASIRTCSPMQKKHALSHRRRQRYSDSDSRSQRERESESVRETEAGTLSTSPSFLSIRSIIESEIVAGNPQSFGCSVNFSLVCPSNPSSRSV